MARAWRFLRANQQHTQQTANQTPHSRSPVASAALSTPEFIREESIYVAAVQIHRLSDSDCAVYALSTPNSKSAIYCHFCTKTFVQSVICR